MSFDIDKALSIARSSVHAFGSENSSPYCDPCGDSSPCNGGLVTVEDHEIDDLIKTNPY